MLRETDFLVIGSGIAGLSFALKAAEKGKVILISKTKMHETNTRYAQGGIASVTLNKDDFSKHIEDTMRAGSFLGKKEIVEMVIREAPKRINELISWGISFDKQKDGSYDLGMEGGHSEPRVLHHKDNTGYAIQETLSDKVRQNSNITVLENHLAIDIITQHHLGRKVKRSHTDVECYGAYIMDLQTNEIHTVLSKITLLATGGAGNIYQTTTNPPIATGDGIAMVYRAKGTIENMEFFQFHPTSLYNPGERPSFLITEALRGFGAKLVNHKGADFMKKYDKRGSLAPRDITARSIDQEMKTYGVDYVFLDCTHLNQEKLAYNFPNIQNKCQRLNINLAKDYIPVVPAAHYQCGGIEVDDCGESTIHHLFAVGEASHTGLHGANRLASNSLLEAVVFAHRAFKRASEQINNIRINQDVPLWRIKGTNFPREEIMITQNMREVQQIMSNYVGIVRSNARLDRALSRLKLIYQETENLYRTSLLSRQICELRNMINVAYLVIKMASERKESIGLHYNVDYPK